MGAFKIEIVGVGGHGCERKAKPGDKLFQRCGRYTCPDCMAFEFVQRMRQAGMVRDGDTASSIELDPNDTAIYEGRHIFTDTASGKRYLQVPQSAEFTHWPGSPSQVVDDMLKNERKSGQF